MASDPKMIPQSGLLSAEANQAAALATFGGVLTVDLDAIIANWRKLEKTAVPAECSAVIKADAYGCGVDPVARALAAAGCKTFFVATLDEARAKRISDDEQDPRGHHQARSQPSPRHDPGRREHAEPARDLQEKGPHTVRRSICQMECHKSSREESESGQSRGEPRRRGFENFLDTGVMGKCRLADSCLMIAEPVDHHALT